MGFLSSDEAQQLLSNSENFSVIAAPIGATADIKKRSTSRYLTCHLCTIDDGMMASFGWRYLDINYTKFPSIRYVMYLVQKKGSSKRCWTWQGVVVWGCVCLGIVVVSALRSLSLSLLKNGTSLRTSTPAQAVLYFDEGHWISSPEPQDNPRFHRQPDSSLEDIGGQTSESCAQQFCTHDATWHTKGHHLPVWVNSFRRSFR